MRIAVIGLPGSGKTVLCTVLSEMFKCLHINFNIMIYDYWADNGKVEDVGEVVKEAVGKTPNYFIDGYPNSIEQYKKMELDQVVHVKILNNSTVIQRLQDRDGIDATETIDYRVNQYYEYTESLINHVRDENKLTIIYGDFPPEHMIGDVVVKLSKKGMAEADNYVDLLMRQMREPKESS